MKGWFITFEGPDGAGKTTQIKKLADYLKQSGRTKVWITREPGGTRIGDHIRSILLAPKHTEMVDQAEVLLYAASRAQHVHEKIKPAMEQGGIVLCDRYIDASIAYQAYGLGIEADEVRTINTFASSGLQPDRTYMIDISPEESRRRLIERASVAYDSQAVSLDRIEQKQLEYHRKVRDGFLDIARCNSDRVLLINGDRNIADVFEDVVADVERLLTQKAI